MISVIQRVLKSYIEIDDNIYASIGSGLLVLSGIKKGDLDTNIYETAKKIVNLRIFNDENGKMNLDVKSVNGEILVISQFTLCTDNQKSGNRPSFYFAEEHEIAKVKFDLFISELKKLYTPEKIKSGIFAENMKVHLINDGPVTIILER